MIYVDIIKKYDNFCCHYNFKTENLISTVSGPSGSGKSTLFKCIAGLLKPDEGVIKLNSRILFDSSSKLNLKPQLRKVGYCFQFFALFPNMSVKENILCGLRYEKDKNLKKQIFSQTVEMLSIADILNKRPSMLSGGQAQRVALARMIVNKNEIFLFDEVFSSLDEDLSLKVQEYVKSVIENLKTQSIFVTHSKNEAKFLTNEHYVINDSELKLTKF